MAHLFWELGLWGNPMWPDQLLVEVMRSPGVLRVDVHERRNVGHANSGLIPFGTLKPSLSKKEWLTGDDEAEFMERFLVHEKIRDAGFVFQ